MSGIDLTEAVEAGVAALRRDGLADDDGTGFVLENVYADGAVHVALSAALPHLEQQIRESVAAEIEARQFLVESTHHFGYGANGWTCLCGFVSPVKRQRTEHITGELDAARIARTRKDT